MSASQIIKLAERVPLLERLEIIDALYASLKRELTQKASNASEAVDEPFELLTFDLGQEVHADRDECL